MSLLPLDSGALMFLSEWVEVRSKKSNIDWTGGINICCITESKW